jgi:outer membrane protein TolC
MFVQAVHLMRVRMSADLGRIGSELFSPAPGLPRRRAGGARLETRAVLRLGLSVCAMAVAFGLLSGCGTSYYRHSADKEVYGIVRQVEGRIFGRSNDFTIDTSYSGREPGNILPAELILDRLQTNQRSLTIEDALVLAARSRRYQTEKEKLYLTALTLTGERHAFSPQFLASAVGNLTRSSSGDVSGSVNSQAGVSQLLQSGGRLGVTLANDLLRYFTGNPRQSVVDTISVNLAQPLLRGFGRNNSALESLTQAERNVVYAVRSYNFFQDQFAVDVVNDYFSLLAQKDAVRNRYTNYLGRVYTTKRLEDRQRAGLEKLSDVDQARQAELTAKNNYVNSVASFRNALDQYKVSLGLPLGETVLLDDRILEEVGRTGLIPVAVEVEAAYRFAVTNQLPLLNEIDRFEDSKRKVRVAADRLRADLNLVGSASLQSEGATDYTRFDASKVNASVGLELNLPLDRLAERNNYRATLVSFEAELRTLTLTFDNLRDSIQRGLRTLEQRRQNYEIQTNALALANQRVDSTTMLQEAGRAEVRDVVDAQDNQIAAQNAVTSALVDHQVARLQLMLDLGALQTTKARFWLQDHLAALRPAHQPAPVPEVSADGTVRPPEHYFNK